MSSEEMVRRARQRVGIGARPGRRPTRRLAVVTCMDTRVDPLALFQAHPGEIHTIENAGGLVTDDVLRSLLISQRYLDTQRVAVVMHTDCGMLGLDDWAEAIAIADDMGVRVPFDLGGFGELEERLTASVRVLRSTPLLPHRDDVRGFIYDVEALRLTEVSIG